MEINVVIAYTLEQVYYKIRRREVEVADKVVVIDCTTNDIRKVQDPWEVARRMGKVLDALTDAKAAAVIGVETKPIRHINVAPYNEAMHRLYISRKKTYGCQTQIRVRDLARDGFHVNRDIFHTRIGKVSIRD